MYRHFEAIGEDKRKRIRDAAMHEFAKDGYQKTSAEQVARAARIAKGMVFHYFGSKRGLFEYLVRYTLLYLRGMLERSRDMVEIPDFLDRYRIVMERKFQAYLEEPYVFELLVHLYTNPEELSVSDQVRADFTEMLDLQRQATLLIHMAGEDERFRADLGAERSKRLIGWLIEGYTLEITAKLRGQLLTEMHLDALWEEGYRLVEDLKRLLYRQEE